MPSLGSDAKENIHFPRIIVHTCGLIIFGEYKCVQIYGELNKNLWIRFLPQKFESKCRFKWSKIKFRDECKEHHY